LLTQAVDSLVIELAAGLDISGWAVVATGGYGRSEMCLQSDIDIMILGRPSQETVRQLFYPLWDTGIKVGHSVRSVKEAAAGAAENLETLCSLLSARLILGDAEQLDQLERQISLLVRRQRSLLDLLAEEERRVREREPFFLQEIDVKSGRGGLRSVHRLDWARRRDEIFGEPPAPDQLGEERVVLLSVRNALHATQGRGAERLAVDLRGTVATWLREDPFDMCAELYAAAREVDDQMMARWPPGSATDFDPVARAGRQLVSAVRSRRQEIESTATTPLPSLVRQLERGPGSLAMPVSAGAWGGWAFEDRSALVELLRAGRGGWDAYRQVEEWGRVALPELAAVNSLPQTAPFHSHPVDSHLWRTVDEVVLLTGGGSEWCAERVEDLGSLDELLLAAWLHDIGKGRSGDHSAIGADLARSLLSRVGYQARTMDLVARAVELHLLLPGVATRQDLDDPDVIDSTAKLIADGELLSILAVLTVADARATGPSVWSDWTETLVRTLVARVAVKMEGGSFQEVDATLEPGLAEHVASMPPGYLQRFGMEMSRTHLELASPPPAGSEARVRVSGDVLPTVVVVARDRPGLLATIAGVFSLHGLNVLEARIATRSDGVAIDTFRVEDVLGSLRIVPADWDRIARDLEEALAGDLDVAARLVAKASAYATPSVDSRVTIEVEADWWKVTVRGPDRVGLLHDLARELTEAGMEITMAKVTTRGSQVVDVFSATPAGATPAALVDRLASVVEGG
jgi:[protein-PII] uridylyltransferase